MFRVVVFSTLLSAVAGHRINWRSKHDDRTAKRSTEGDETMNIMEMVMQNPKAAELADAFAEQMKTMMADPDFQKQAELFAEEAMEAEPLEQFKLTAQRMETMMQNPKFRQQGEVLAEKMEELASDPELQEQATRVAKQMEATMADPSFQEKLQEQLDAMQKQLEANPDLQKSMDAIQEQIEEALSAPEEVAEVQPKEALTSLLSMMEPSLAFNAPMARKPAAGLSQPRALKSTLKHRLETIEMVDEPDDKAVTVGAAALAGLVGAQIGDLKTAAIFALLAAYSTTLSNELGDSAKSAGKFATKTYDRANELNTEYGVLNKAKKATDAVVTVADNINENYGITDKLEAEYGILGKLEGAKDQATSKIDELTGKMDDIKSKASSSS